MTLFKTPRLPGEAEIDAAATVALAEQGEALAAALRAATNSDFQLLNDDNTLILGSRAADLRQREVGSAGVRPRPVLAGVCAVRGAAMASAVGRAVVDELRGA